MKKIGTIGNDTDKTEYCNWDENCGFKDEDTNAKLYPAHSSTF